MKLTHLFATVALLVTVSSCCPAEEEVRAEFDALVANSNACTQQSDCVMASTGGCPLGCGVAVNRESQAEVEQRGQELVADYECGGKACDYECMPFGDPTCESGRCVANIAN